MLTVQKKLSMNCSKQHWRSNHEHQSRYFYLCHATPHFGWTWYLSCFSTVICTLFIGVGPERILVEGYCDKKISCFASTIGSGAPGLTQRRRVYHGLHGSVREKLIDRSSLSEAYYQASNTVDRHNQYSSFITHGFSWQTQHYSHRVFGSVIAYIATNAFLAMKWERSSVNKEFEFSRFSDFVRALSFLAVGSPTLQLAHLFLLQLTLLLLTSLILSRVVKPLLLFRASAGLSANTANAALCNIARAALILLILSLYHTAITNQSIRMECVSSNTLLACRACL